jgi:hypothetical protein
MPAGVHFTIRPHAIIKWPVIVAESLFVRPLRDLLVDFGKAFSGAVVIAWAGSNTARWLGRYGIVRGKRFEWRK